MTETAMVISVVIILAAFLVPRFHTGMKNLNLQSALHESVTAINYARQAAITLRDVVQLHIPHGSRTIYVVNVDTGDTLKTFYMPPQTFVREAVGPLTFEPRGICSSGQLHVENPDHYYKVEINRVARTEVVYQN